MHPVPRRAHGAIVVAALLGACSSVGPSPSAPSLTPSASPSLALVTPSVSADGPQPYVGGPLEPGWYRTEHLDPAMAFRISDVGWNALFDEDPEGGFAFELGGKVFVGLAHVPKVITPDGEIGDAPEDLAAWLLAHPRLEAHELNDRTSLAGLPVRAVEYTTTSDVTLYYHPGGNFHVPAGSTGREYVMQRDGPDLDITVVFDDASAVERIDALLNSLQILDGG